MHKNAIYFIQDSLENAVKMAFLKPDHLVCVYTDGSEELWAAVEMQTNKEELGKSVEQQ